MSRSARTTTKRTTGQKAVAVTASLRRQANVDRVLYSPREVIHLNCEVKNDTEFPIVEMYIDVVVAGIERWTIEKCTGRFVLDDAEIESTMSGQSYSKNCSKLIYSDLGGIRVGERINCQVEIKPLEYHSENWLPIIQTGAHWVKVEIKLNPQYSTRSHDGGEGGSVLAAMPAQCDVYLVDEGSLWKRFTRAFKHDWVTWMAFFFVSYLTGILMSGQARQIMSVLGKAIADSWGMLP